MNFTPGSMPNVCAECAADLTGKPAWVRSGKLLCMTCDFAHKSTGHQVAAARHRRAAAKSSTPRRRGTYYKPQYYDVRRGVLAWVDVQRICDTAEEALALARAEAPRRATQVRAMEVTDKGRQAMPPQPR